ncbi:MAG: response regulator, partial [Candidatus Hydrogenedentes bacterium]|nr:response regulator [Candidatus Hydrogenedentota bacterium]
QTDKRAGRTILVVDDEAAVRNLTVKALERAGYRVITAGDGRQGVERFRDNADKISLVLLDMTMPYKDGGEVFQEIRQLRRDAKVILSSGFSEEDTMERFGQHGLAGFIQKPYRVTDLLGIISSALNSPGQ